MFTGSQHIWKVALNYYIFIHSVVSWTQTWKDCIACYLFYKMFTRYAVLHGMETWDYHFRTFLKFFKNVEHCINGYEQLHENDRPPVLPDAH